MAKKIEIENRGRHIWRFQVQRPSPRKGAPPIRVHDADLVIGMADDTDQALGARGVTRNARCPSPVVVIPEDHEALKIPSNREAFDALVADGTFRVRDA